MNGLNALENQGRPVHNNHIIAVSNALVALVNN